MAEFITVGRVAINPDTVTCAEWAPHPGDPQKGWLVVNMAGAKDYSFEFDLPGVPELAAAVGLGEFGGEWKKAKDAKLKAAETARVAEAKAAKAAEDKAAKDAKDAAAKDAATAVVEPETPAEVPEPKPHKGRHG
jgi:hypothetical protein